MTTQTYNPCDIVTHKLTREKMIVLNQDGWGIAYGNPIRVRTTNYEIIDVYPEEVTIKA